MIWGVLGVLMSYEITRGITLVVGRVTERVEEGFRWGLGGVTSSLGGSA